MTSPSYRLTTDHPASRDGVPVLVGRFNEAAGADPRLATVFAMMGAGIGTVLD